MASARPILPFFRPLATPRPVATRQILRFSQCARLRDEAAPSVTTASTTSPADPNAEPTSQATPTLLPYHVSRTKTQGFPVYQSTKSGGNYHQTKLRKISGDVKKLRDELKEHLGLQDKDIHVNSVTQHIIAKGDYKEKIIQYLKERNF